MPRWLVITLLVVFGLHLVAFARLAVVRREGYYVLISGTFTLLVLSFSLRLAAPALSLGGLGLYWYPRAMAWICAAVTVVWTINRRRARARQVVLDASAERERLRER